MSRKILISLGSLSILGAAACALSFFDFNLARTIKEEEDGDFAFQSQDKPETPKTPSEEPAPTPGLTPNTDPEEVEEPKDDPKVAIVVPPKEEEEETESLLGTEEEAEQLATSVNDTVAQDNKATETPKNLKNEQITEEKKTSKSEEAPKKPAPVPEPKTPVPSPKPEKPDTKQNQTTPSKAPESKKKSNEKSKSSSSGTRQSVRDRWTKSNNNKEAEPVPGISSTNLIRDYSFRFVNSCTSGTIWILDYEIPSGENTYPTKFFFGTSAQVTSKIKFDDKNPYGQKLPTNNTSCSNPQLVRETDLNYGGPDHHMPELWEQDDKGFIDANDNNDVEKWKTETHEPPYFKYKIKNMNLVYVATDFAGTSSADKWGQGHKSNAYIADFAVVEIDFKDQDVAKKMTRNFHGRYGKTQDIDFFARPLMERKSNEELYTESLDIFVAGYSKHGLRGRSVGSFNLNTRQASKLAYSDNHEMIKDGSEEEIIGHANACHSQNSIKGYGEERHLRGVEIVLSHEPLEEGSLGSLVTDGEGKAIGVKSKYDKTKQTSTITAFRSKEIKYKDKVVIPEYDLISGIDNDPHSTSYKDVISKHILKDSSRKTYLSQKKNWSAKKQP